MFQNIFWANARASRGDLLRKYSENKGIKDAPRAPSPVTRLIRFGIWKTRINESAAGEVPSRRAIR
jgi:hypothetical protein